MDTFLTLSLWLLAVINIYYIRREHDAYQGQLLATESLNKTLIEIEGIKRELLEEQLRLKRLAAQITSERVNEAVPVVVADIKGKTWIN